MAPETALARAQDIALQHANDVQHDLNERVRAGSMLGPADGSVVGLAEP
jgi:hypothetical protein